MSDTDLYTVETNIPGVRFFKPPPGNFVGLKASNEELLRYGFPPRPLQDVRSKAYSEWAKVVTGKYERVFPRLRQAKIRRELPAILPEIPRGGTTQNPQWSGVSLIARGNAWGTLASVAYAWWEVPTCPPPTLPIQETSCLVWVGIDGSNGSTDVFQGGTFSISQIFVSTTEAFFEWFPDAAVLINGNDFAVRAGDLLRVAVFVCTPTDCVINIVNGTTGKMAPPCHIYPQSGQRIWGNCVEWIVERPQLGGNIASLLDYGKLEMDHCEASSQTLLSTPANPGSGINMAYWKMVENSNVVSQATIVPVNSYYSSIDFVASIPKGKGANQ
jgi:hypothetical protein